jgi:hypothetical protein
MKITTPLIFSIYLLLFTNSLFPIQQDSENLTRSKQSIKLQRAVDAGKIRYKLTEPNEIIELLGPSYNETIRKDGGMDILEISYPQIHIIFGKVRNDEHVPFTLLHLSINEMNVDIGQNSKLILRNHNDLKKIDRFWGFQNVSLKKLDLKEDLELLKSMTFDSFTEWPEKDKLPKGFDPQYLLDIGRNPGLGILNLHEKGINGKGVGIAIIDQPLLLGHKEYTSRLVRYDATNLVGFSPQMHGSPVASIAVGKEIGVAPEATLTYFAVPMWEKKNSHYIKSLRRIFELNKYLPEEERIRVVSISDGAFSSYNDFQNWKNVLKEAEGLRILVVTCDPNFLNYGTLTLIEGKDPNKPESYILGKYSDKNNVLLIPTGNRTVASHRGIDVYTYDREGGRSWAAPYIAGLAALAFQVNSSLLPKKVVELLIKTATKTPIGSIVNPVAFIEAVRKE